MTTPRAAWTLWELSRNGWSKRVTVKPGDFESGKEFLYTFVEMNIAKFANGYWGDPNKYCILLAGRTPSSRKVTPIRGKE